MADKEVDEIAETVLDCIMNSHYISEEGIRYVLQHIPTKQQFPDSLCIELYEKVEKDRNNRFALIFKTHDDAKTWYSQTRNSVSMPQRIARKAFVIDNVIFSFTEGGKYVGSYVEFISEFIDMQPICVLQHTVTEKYLYQAENHHLYYKITWDHKGQLPQQSSLGNNDRSNVKDEAKKEESLSSVTPVRLKPSIKPSKAEVKQEITVVSDDDEFDQFMPIMQKQLRHQQAVDKSGDKKSKAKQSSAMQKQMRELDEEDDEDEQFEDEDDQFDIDYDEDD